MDDERKKLLDLILGLREDPYRKSTLQLALEKARHSCGIEQGVSANENTFGWRQNMTELAQCLAERGIEKLPICTEETDLFTALFLYLNILEQLGVLFCGKNRGIANSIKRFSNNKDGDVLRNLRNSLAHSFGLVNIKKCSKCHREYPTIKFILSLNRDETNVVQLAQKEWDGDYSDKSDKTSTTVYVFPFINLAEEIIAKARKETKDGRLDFALKDIEEIKSRFTILINNN